MKPGYKTTELLLTVLASIGSATNTIPPHAQPKVIAVVIGYAIARALTKFGAGLAGDVGIDLNDWPDPITEPAPHQSPPETPPATP